MFQYCDWILATTVLKDETMTSAASNDKSPVGKVVSFLKKARDGWKEKYQQVKQRLRRAENQVRAVEASRENWRERALAAEAEVKAKKVTSRPRAM